MTVRRVADDAPQWVLARTRPGEGAPSHSGMVRGSTATLALIRYLERWPQQEVGTRVDVCPRGSREIVASYERTEHVWDRISD